jgi:hypothetical protein
MADGYLHHRLGHDLIDDSHERSNIPRWGAADAERYRLGVNEALRPLLLTLAALGAALLLSRGLGD